MKNKYFWVSTRVLIFFFLLCLYVSGKKNKSVQFGSHRLFLVVFETTGVM